MMLKSCRIAQLLDDGLKDETEDPLVITPCPDIKKIRESGSGSIDLRLGCWFMRLRQARKSHLAVDDRDQIVQSQVNHIVNSFESTDYHEDKIDFTEEHKDTLTSALAELADNEASENQLTKTSYVRFGDNFILHPGSFVLGITLEWVRFPTKLAGLVVGRSSWGRRGLIIATAIAVHPGFKGCITLELTNVGEIPISLKPGMRVCQLCLYELEMENPECKLADKSQFACRRKPVLGKIEQDDFAKILAHPRF